MDGILLYEHLVWLVPAKNADTVSSRLLRCLHASKAPNLGRQQKKMRRKWLRQEETKHKRGQEETKNIVSSYTTSKIGALTMARASNWFIDASFEKEWKVNESICWKILFLNVFTLLDLLYGPMLYFISLLSWTLKSQGVRSQWWEHHKQAQVTHALW